MSGRTLDALARLLAVLGPLLVIAASGWWFLEAGADVHRSELVTSMERELRAKDPDIVVIGHSAAESILESTLEEATGLSAAVFPVPHSQAPIWYAILKNRVVRNGHKPRLLVVASQLGSLLNVDPGKGVDTVRLFDQMGPDEPVLARKVFGLRKSDTLQPDWSTVQSRLRSQILEFLRDRVLLAMAEETPDGIPTVGAGRSALDEVLGNDQAGWQVDLDALTAKPARAAARLDETLVPDMLDLAEEIGARLIVVRMPVDAAYAGVYAVDPKVRAALTTLLNERGAGYVDPSAELGSGDFKDPVHLFPKARVVFTEALVRDLEEMGALGDGPLASARVPYPAPEIRREGTPPGPWPIQREDISPHKCGFEAQVGDRRALMDPALLAAGLPPASPLVVTADGVQMELRQVPQGKRSRQGCIPGTFLTGDKLVTVHPSPNPGPGKRKYHLAIARDPVRASRRQGLLAWVAPGTSTVMAFDRGWEAERGPFAVRVEATPIAGGGGVPQLSIDGGTAHPLVGHGGRMVGQFAADAPEDAWKLAVSSPEDGPYLALRRIALGRGDQREEVIPIGSSDPDEISVLLLGRARALDDTRFTTEPPAGFDAEVRAGRDGTGTIEVPGWADVDDFRSYKCSPLVVTLDGRPLKWRGTRCAKVPDMRSSQCHDGERIVFRPPTPTIPKKVHIDLDRFCETRAADRPGTTWYWLAPDDRINARTDQAGLIQFFEGASTLELTGRRFGSKGSVVRVSARLDGEPALDTVVPLTARANVHRMPLPTVVPPTAGELEVSIVNDSDGWVLLQRVAISERLLQRAEDDGS